MHVLYISQFFTPEPMVKGASFVRALQDLGHTVEVITAFPNYPGGRLYAGYELRPWMRETLEGVDILRVPLYPSHNRNALARIATYSSFALAGALAATTVRRRPDVAYVYHSPPTVGLAALALRHIRGVPVIYDIQDLWPDTLAATGMFGWKPGLEMVEHWCRTIYRSARRIIVSSVGMKERLVERGVPREKIEVIWNWSPEEQTTAPALPRELEALFDGSAFSIVFAGTIGLAQGLLSVLEAASILRARGSTIRIVFVGDGVELALLKSVREARGLHNVHFVPRMPSNQIGAVLARADALMVHLGDDPLFRVMIPSKTQAYMAAGRPILMAVAGDASALVERAAAGLVCTPEDAAGLALVMEQMARTPLHEREEMGERARRFYRQHMSFAVGVARTDAVLREAANVGP